MDTITKRSLRTNFLLSLSVGAVALTIFGVLATYHIASEQLHEQLVQRGRLLASAINHSAMIASNEADLAHVANEVMRDNPEITGLIILGQDGRQTIFQSFLWSQMKSQAMSQHLRREAAHAMDTGAFGIHQHDDGHLQVIVPLTTPIGSHAHRGSSKPEASHVPGNAAKTTVRTQANLQAKSDHNHDDVAAGIQHEKMTMAGHTNDTLGVPESESIRPANKSMSMGTFGAVLIVFDQKSIMQGLNAILWRLAPTSLVGITMTLLLCYLLLHYQVLKPIGSIRTAMMRQQTGERDARAESQSSLEIDDVASALNRMLDTLNEREDTIKLMALTDPLTGLANRNLFDRKLQNAFENAKRSEDKVALLMVDLDRFKVINDTYGHPAGDALLIEVARTLEFATRNNDTVARLGGDEFAVIATSLKDLDFLHHLAGRIIEGVSDTVAAELANGTSASIGIAIYPDDAQEPDELCRLADLALYQAKDSGRGVYRIYDDSLHSKTLERQRLEQDLRRAIDEGELILHYQPQIDIKTGKLLTVEALVRWRHPERGLIPPDEFIPVAETSNQIISLGDWVLSTACRRNRAWQDAGVEPFRVSVNVSAREIQLDSFADRVGEILAETGLLPKWLELEITETAVMSDLGKVMENFHKLIEMGVDIAIDDFGTGHSSLTNLYRLPFAKLKIDRSFICEITEDPDARSITEAVIGIGGNLGLIVIAEGVETQAQMALLEKLGCDLAQGYGISKPLDADDMGIWLGEQEPGLCTAIGW